MTFSLNKCGHLSVHLDKQNESNCAGSFVFECLLLFNHLTVTLSSTLLLDLPSQVWEWWIWPLGLEPASSNLHCTTLLAHHTLVKLTAPIKWTRISSLKRKIKRKHKRTHIFTCFDYLLIFTSSFTWCRSLTHTHIFCRAIFADLDAWAQVS